MISRQGMYKLLLQSCASNRARMGMRHHILTSSVCTAHMQHQSCDAWAWASRRQTPDEISVLRHRKDFGRRWRTSRVCRQLEDKGYKHVLTDAAVSRVHQSMTAKDLSCSLASSSVPAATGWLSRLVEGRLSTWAARMRARSNAGAPRQKRVVEFELATSQNHINLYSNHSPTITYILKGIRSVQGHI